MDVVVIRGNIKRAEEGGVLLRLGGALVILLFSLYSKFKRPRPLLVCEVNAQG